MFEIVRGMRVRRAAGPPDSDLPPLVLLAAWPQSLACWDGHWGALAERHELVGVELPGFGLAPLAPRKTMRPSAQAAALAELLDRLELGPAVVVGPDVGVPVALRLAQDRPDLVAGLVLFDGPASYPPHLSWEGRLLVRSRTARRLATPGGTAFALELFRRGYRRGRPSRSVVLEHLRTAASPRRFAGHLAFVGSYPEELPEIERRLGEVTAPVLVTWGLEDVFVLPDEGRRLAAALPAASWEPLAGCGHYAHEDAGPAFTALLERWVTGAVAPRAAVASG